MAYGVGGAIAEGLKSGFEMGRQVDIDRAAVQERERTAARQAVIDERAAKAAELAQVHNELAASRERLGMLATEGAGFAQQYGGDVSKIPVDVQTEYATRTQAARRGHEALLNKIAPAAQDWRQSAEDDASRMKTGQLDPLDPKYPAARLVHTLTATARRPLQDFMPQGDQPAPVMQMVNDFRTGLQTQNEGLTLKALNGLFAPELKTGVGQPSPHGGVVVGKQVVKLVPAPPGGPEGADPNAGKVTPVLRVFVREGPESQAGVGETQRMASIEQQQYGAPPGATGHYDAPVTQNRSSDPNDPIAHISMEDAMNRIGQMETLASSMTHPELRAKVEQGLQEAGTAPGAFLQSLYSVGGKMPTKQETYENIHVAPGMTLRITKGPTGAEVGREWLTPPAGMAEKVGPTAKAVAEIKALPELSDAERAQAVRVKLGLAARPKAPSTGGDTIKHGAAGLSEKQNAALFGKDGAVTTGRLDPGKINSRTASIFADAEIANPGTDFAKMSGDIALGRNATFRQKAMTAEVLPEIMGNMVEAGKKVGFSDSRTLGKMQMWVKGQLNDPDMTEYMAQRNDALMTIAGVMRSTGMSDMAHRAETEVAEPTMSPQALDAWMRGQMKSLAPRLENYRKITAGRVGGGAAPAAKAAVSAEDDALINKYLKK